VPERNAETVGSFGSGIEKLRCKDAHAAPRGR
jgi:hypothetical protein